MTKCLIVSRTWVELGRVHTTEMLKFPSCPHTLEHLRDTCGAGPGTEITRIEH